MILSNTTWGKAVLAAAVGLTMTTAPAAAETPQTDFEFDQRVRDALLRNPDIILEVFALLEAKEEAAKAVKDQELIAKVADELFEGLDPAKPILVEFQDYNCGYCRRAHPVVASLKETMPDLQLVLMETPVLGKESTFTAKAALALKALKGVDAYREFSDAMMSVQGKASAATTIRTLVELGHDPEEITAAVNKGIGADDLEKAKRLVEHMAPGGRVVNLSSAAQAPVDLNALRGQGQLGDGPAYAQSKLAITMWSRSLALELGDAGPLVVSVNPASMLGTNMVRDAYGVSGGDVMVGADIVARAATSSEFEGRSGQYYDNDAKRFSAPHPDGMDPTKLEALTRTVHELSVNLGGLPR